MNKAKQEKLDIPYDITEFIASSIKDDIRSMEGALVRLLAIASLKKENINIDLAKNIISDIVGQAAIEQISIEQVSKAVSQHLNVVESKLYGKSRQMEIALARQVAMFLSRELTQSSLVTIGRHFGKRDHSTVIHACKTIEDKIKSDNNVNMLINKIKAELAN